MAMTLILTMLAVISLTCLVGCVFAVTLYNRLVSLRHGVRKAWSDIDVLLKQRYDEIPKLVEVCRGYMKHERETLESVIQARNAAAGARGVAEHRKADGALAGLLSGLFALSEDYPELKANQNFLGLQRRISTLEDQLADRRELYNAHVNTYNVRIEQVPDVFIARLMGFSGEELYVLDDQQQRESPQISFG
jgi:LemA protein